ncbi:putative DASH complex subunit spc19 [Triangularia verruculosa]|uniref:DASH complex subunit SPC19 n=1 Tax=Triangularia verruculosa TaxID=2587418 RepID=A0AAN7AQM2_9PEZI|nr:putative DASH complex subunit spc19 [Triangularia verruculosa]
MAYQSYQQQQPSYASCVTSLRTSLSYLESSVSTLDNGISDFPRLTSLLKTVRHYELIPQPTLAAAEASLRDEIGPFISLLLDRAEKNIDRQARRIETLKAKAELNAGRLSHYPSEGGSSAQQERERRQQEREREKKLKAARGGRLDGSAALRAKVASQRKEALKYSVERLEMEVQQKERELRKRLERA